MAPFDSIATDDEVASTGVRAPTSSATDTAATADGTPYTSGTDDAPATMQHDKSTTVTNSIGTSGKPHATPPPASTGGNASGSRRPASDVDPSTSSESAEKKKPTVPDGVLKTPQNIEALPRGSPRELDVGRGRKVDALRSGRGTPSLKGLPNLPMRTELIGE